MGYYNELSMEPLDRAMPVPALPGDEAYDAGRHAARISYQLGWDANGWRHRYFASYGEAYRARHAFRRARYRVAVQGRAVGGWE